VVNLITIVTISFKVFLEKPELLNAKSVGGLTNGMPQKAGRGSWSLGADVAGYPKEFWGVAETVHKQLLGGDRKEWEKKNAES